MNIQMQLCVILALYTVYTLSQPTVATCEAMTTLQMFGVALKFPHFA